MFKTKQCKIDNCNNPSWKDGCCKSHCSNAPLKRNSFNKTIDVNKINEMQNFFMSIWKERKNISEVSGEKLFSPPSSAYFHHIIAKSKYPELKFEKDNIIILSLDEHANVENDMYKYPEINKRREQLKIKYNISK